MSDSKRKDRSGDQPLPVPNDGPSMHDLVCADLRTQPWMLPGAVIEDLQARKQLGLERYGSLLQAHNGRDSLLDLYEELQDATVYARQVLEENGLLEGIERTYNALLCLLVRVRRFRDGH